MDSFKDSVAFWATILGTLLGVFGAIKSLTWLVVMGVLVVFGAIGTLVYARKQRQLVKSAALKVAGRSLDSLNVASLRRRMNRSLVVQQARESGRHRRRRPRHNLEMHRVLPGRS